MHRWQNYVVGLLAPKAKHPYQSRGTMKVLNFSLAKRQGESNDIVLANQIFPGILEMPFQGGSMPPDLSFLGAGGSTVCYASRPSYLQFI